MASVFCRNKFDCWPWRLYSSSEGKSVSDAGKLSSKQNQQ